MSVPAGRMRAKRLKGASEGTTTIITSRGRKRKVNLLKKIIKDEIDEEEKKYFGKEKNGMEVEKENNNSEGLNVSLKVIMMMMKVKMMQRLKKKKQ